MSEGQGVSPEADRFRLAIALSLIVAFMAAEVVVGLIAHSLALLSDAGHMLTDAGAIAFSLVAMRLAARPPKGGFTYGLKRLEIFSALTNGGTLLVVAVIVSIEAIRRLLHPPGVHGSLVLYVALAGIAVNLAATWQLARSERKSLNVEGSLKHIVTDLFAFVGTAVAAAVIITTGIDRADALASLLVAGLMIKAGYDLVRSAVRILMEAAPKGMDVAAIGRALSEHPRVTDVHDFHLWEVTSGFPALSAHVLVGPADDCHAVRVDLERMLHDRFGIDHTTLQVDHHHEGQPLEISMPPEQGRASRAGT
jgi:cobalt-zinc-cadmium efflux system protein